IMKKIKNLMSKKLLIVAFGFVLLVATMFGILFGNRNAHAESSNDVIEISQDFVIGLTPE
ncbi:MAG: hypothetical protein K2K80_02080, partial [Clostridia bacterium]|nr:hypothetical protein [Clostridia bacterium]